MNAVGVTALVVLAVVSVLWTVLLIPALLELRRASWRLQEFIRTLELELRPTLQEARETIRAMTQAAQGVGEALIVSKSRKVISISPRSLSTRISACSAASSVCRWCSSS